MPVYLDSHSRSLLFIHVPKCAGSSVESMLKVVFRKQLYLLKGMHPDFLPGLRCSPQHYHLDVLRTFLDLEEMTYSFGVCRRPFDRVVSEYKWQCSNSGNDLSPAEWWEEMKSAYVKNQWVCDNHLRPQIEFLDDSAVEIFKLEDGLSQVVNRISESFHLDPIRVGLLKLLSQTMRKKSKSADQVDRAFLEIQRDVEMYYSVDYKFLNYGVR